MSLNFTKVPEFPIADAPIFASLLVGNTLYVGGSFNNIGGLPRRGLAAIDMTTYAVLPWDPKMGAGEVKALAYMNGRVYVGGAGFVEVNKGAVSPGVGYPVSNLFPVDAITAVFPLTWTVRAFGAYVNALDTDGSTTIFVGGQFTVIGTYNRFFAAAMDDTGTPTVWDPDPNGPVNCLSYRPEGGGTVYLGGLFTRLHNHSVQVPRSFAAKVDTVGVGGISVWDPHPNSSVMSLLLLPNAVMLGGLFNTLNAGSVPVTYVGKVDDSLGAAEPFLLKSAAPVPTMAILDGMLYISNFSAPMWNGATYDPYYAGNYGTARTDQNGVIDPTFRYDTNGPSRTITTYGGGTTGLQAKLFFGGVTNMDHGPVSAANVVICDTLGAPLHAEVGVRQGVGGDVSSVALDVVNRVGYLCGSFQYIRGANGEFPRRGLAAFDLDTRNILPWAPELVPGENAYGILFLNGVIYVVGNMLSAGPAGGPLLPRKRAAAFDTAGNLLPWAPALDDNSAFCLTTDGTYIYIGGTFDVVAGGGWGGPARFDKVSGAHDPAWNPAATGMGGAIIYDLEMNEANTGIYVAGQFTGIGGGGQSYIARLNLVNAGDDGFAGTLDGFSWSVFEHAGKVYAAGFFGVANGQPRPMGGAVWDLAGVLDPYIIPGQSGSYPLHRGPANWYRSRPTFPAPRGFQTFDFSNAPTGVDPGLNGPAGSGFSSTAFADDTLGGTVVVVGQFFRAGSTTGNFRALFVGPPAGAAPRKPNINFYLRKDRQTVLKWDQVFMDVAFNRIQVDAYNIYRSTNTNLETFELVKTITSLDVLGNVDTMFTEYIEGFFAYRVTAVYSGKESEPALAKQVNSAFGADFI